MEHASPKILNNYPNTFKNKESHSQEYFKALKYGNTIKKLNNAVFLGSYTLDNELVYYLIDKDTESVLYQSKYIESNEPHFGLVVRQADIWRDKTRIITEGIATNVLTSLVMKKYSTVISDFFQTADGTKMWRRLIKIPGFTAGIYNEEEGEIIDIKEQGESVASFMDKVNYAVGDTMEHMSYVFFLTKKKVKI